MHFVFTINNMKKTGLERSVRFFSVNFNPIDTNLDIHKCFMKGKQYKIMFRIIKKNMFIVSLINS